MTEPQNITIIGAGLMGHGIAYALTASGHKVRVFDRSAEALESLGARLLEIAELFGDNGDAAKSVTACFTLSEAALGADIVIEAAVENLEIKQFIVAELEAIVEPSTIITSNTSAIPISKIAAKAQYPERIVGTHFWNPPHLVKLVEVVTAEKSAPEAVQRTLDLLSRSGYRAVHVKKDIPGFIGNRLQHALKREAIALVANGVCDAETVDDVVKLGFGSRLSVLGPLEQSDLVGLSLTQAIHDTLIPDLDTTDATHPLLNKLVAEGNLGMSTGKGFRKWTPESADAVRKRLRDYLVSQAKSQKS